MLAQPSGKRVTCRVSAAIVMTLSGTLVAPMAFARITANTIEGRTVVACAGGNEQWEVQASTQGRKTFGERLATSAALSRTTEHRKTTDARQWLVDIALAAKAT
jgi:hypothetical protein